MARAKEGRDIFVFDDGPREVVWLNVAPTGDYSNDRPFIWLWRHWAWFDRNADFGSRWAIDSFINGFRMAWRLKRLDE